jgi:hypothetical protein
VALIDLDKISCQSSNGGENNMSNAYAAVSALIFAIVALMHLVRLLNRWPVVIGPHQISMNVSWAALVVAALLAVWGFLQLPPHHMTISVQAQHAAQRSLLRVGQANLLFASQSREAQNIISLSTL